LILIHSLLVVFIPETYLGGTRRRAYGPTGRRQKGAGGLSKRRASRAGIAVEAAAAAHLQPSL
jgi:hypothetical protein